jgi:hypothetical protein
MRAEFPPGSLPEGLPARIQAHYADRPFSLFPETSVLLSLGVLALSTGLGILVYKHIDTLGHQTILAFIAAGALACYAFVWKRAPAFAWGRTSAGAWSDALLWLGALLTGTFVGYLQARYTVFGRHTAIAVALPAAGYLLSAYRFDHRGVLLLGITGLCAAAGAAVTPAEVFRAALFDARVPAFTGLLLAGAWGAAAFLSRQRGCKPHFAFSYGNFAAHLFFLSALTGMFVRSGMGEGIHFLLAAGGACGVFAYARSAQSAYFTLLAVAYGYIAITAILFRHVLNRGWVAGELGMLYFLLSCGGAVWLFLNLKQLAGKDHAGE